MENNKIKIFKKLQEAREQFAKEKPKKTGHNDQLGYDFFQLEDIVPKKLEIFKKLRLADIITFSSETAILSLMDLDSGEILNFRSPMPKNFKSLHPNEMQAIGSCETYQRRYLYMSLLDIVEDDPFDSHSRNIQTTQTMQELPEPPLEDINNLPEVGEDIPLPLFETTTPQSASQSPKRATKVAEKKKEPEIDLSVNDKYSPSEDVESLINKLAEDEEYVNSFLIPTGKQKGNKLSTMPKNTISFYAEKYSGKDNRIKAIALLLMENLRGEQ